MSRVKSTSQSYTSAIAQASERRSTGGRNVSASALSSASYSDDSITPVTRRRATAHGTGSTSSTHPELPRTRRNRRSGERRTVTRSAMESVLRRRNWKTSPGRKRRTGRLFAATRNAA